MTVPPSIERNRIERNRIERNRIEHWDVRLELSDSTDACEVVAHLDAGDRSMSGVGRARRNPADPSLPQVGEELATARALHDLAHHLSQDAWRMIEDAQTER
jgi:hypothetical protein